MTMDRARRIQALEEFPNPNAIAAAYRSEVMTPDTTDHLERDRRNWKQKFLDLLLPN